MKKAEDVTVLYVDDEKNNLFLFEVTFRSSYKVITALDAEEGLEKLERHADDILVVISDMRMPKVNGIEFITEARKKYDNISYFILSGFEYNDQIDRAVKSNLVDKFFTKPLNFEEIKKSIDQEVARLKKKG